jgi:tight adherence protein B
VVGLLKTGMTPLVAISAAAEGLEPDSLLRLEVETMIERTRYGVSEDASIGSFGEDINHPEIELFVQALLLSRSVGGVLSDTLERLARQTRRRQHFRASAMSQVSLQRASIVVIVLILICIEVFLYFTFPEAVVGSLKHPKGYLIWQFALLCISGGIYWSRRVTDIRL